MKRAWVALVIALATCGFALVTAPPAGAATTCSVNHKGTPLAERRCSSNPANAPGVKFVGTTVWEYTGNSAGCSGPAPCGNVHGTLTDTDANDGSCAWISMEWTGNGPQIGPEQVTDPSCGTGDPIHFTLPFNCPNCRSAQNDLLDWHTIGTWHIFVKTNHSSGEFFQIAVATKGVDTRSHIGIPGAEFAAA
jgi:hypothetical protein